MTQLRSNPTWIGQPSTNEPIDIFLQTTGFWCLGAARIETVESRSISESRGRGCETTHCIGHGIAIQDIPFGHVGDMHEGFGSGDPILKGPVLVRRTLGPEGVRRVRQICAAEILPGRPNSIQRTVCSGTVM